MAAMRLGWATDIHLDWLEARERAEFYTQLRNAVLDALLLGGDIGLADSSMQFLAEMAGTLAIPIYFVLGNHDFYGGSIRGVREAAGRQVEALKGVHWLTASGVIPLTGQTALVGHDSWADGRNGDFFASEVMLTEYYAVEELRDLEKPERYAKLNALGDEAAEFLEQRVLEALTGWRQVIVLTHVPPFREACVYQGRISNDDFLPHFSCRAVGERLANLMRSHPDRRMTVLCGHTHGAGFTRILDNLVVHTGGVEYGAPSLQQVLEPE